MVNNLCELQLSHSLPQVKRSLLLDFAGLHMVNVKGENDQCHAPLRAVAAELSYVCTLKLDVQIPGMCIFCE